ncbi:hypothetical protein ACGFNP_56645 [Nonomuraea sp. NPDC049269]|uniref:hypothetical protein n=1 Tax=Nonomuraea sp. NPDC049269 TaxID=3364349 RepID=UPI003717025B
MSPADDDFDLDIRLGTPGVPRPGTLDTDMTSTCITGCQTCVTCNTCPALCTHQTNCDQPTCHTCGQETCETCHTNCATCHGCPTQDTCPACHTVRGPTCGDTACHTYDTCIDCGSRHVCHD